MQFPPIILSTTLLDIGSGMMSAPVAVEYRSRLVHGSGSFCRSIQVYEQGADSRPIARSGRHHYRYPPPELAAKVGSDAAPLTPGDTRSYPLPRPHPRCVVARS